MIDDNARKDCRAKPTQEGLCHLTNQTKTRPISINIRANKPQHIDHHTKLVAEHETDRDPVKYREVCKIANPRKQAVGNGCMESAAIKPIVGAQRRTGRFLHLKEVKEGGASLPEMRQQDWGVNTNSRTGTYVVGGQRS